MWAGQCISSTGLYHTQKCSIYQSPSKVLWPLWRAISVVLIAESSIYNLNLLKKPQGSGLVHTTVFFIGKILCGSTVEIGGNTLRFLLHIFTSKCGRFFVGQWDRGISDWFFDHINSTSIWLVAVHPLGSPESKMWQNKAWKANAAGVTPFVLSQFSKRCTWLHYDMSQVVLDWLTH